MARRALFFYGSLRDETLLSCVLGRAPEAVSLEAAVLPGHEVRAVAGEGFPCIVAREGAEAPGALLRDATEAEAARVAFFEDEAEFELAPMTVRAAGGEAQEALVCRPLARIAPQGPWRLEDWEPEARAMLIEAAQEVMALYEAGVDWSDPALWPGIQARAAARARGKGEARRPGLPGAPGAGTGAGTGAGAAGAELVAHRRAHAGFHAAEVLRVRTPRLDGGLAEAAERSVWVTGDAAIVLPYDAARDAVLLISQWRPGPFLRGDRQCWTVEAVAGRVDPGETPEAAARREAVEEAGLRLGRMEPAGAYYCSPGSSSQFYHTFLAEADLGAAGGVGGAAEEGEEVLSRVLPFDEALAMAEAGAVDSGPALTLLLRLALRREALRTAWG